MHDYLTTVASSLTEATEEQRTYPVLRYCHTVSPQSSPAVATLVLADTLYLTGYSLLSQGPGPGLTALLEASLSRFADVKPVRSTSADDRAVHEEVLTVQARSLGIETGAGSPFAAGFEEYLERRRYLVAACRDDGWGSQVAA